MGSRVRDGSGKPINLVGYKCLSNRTTYEVDWLVADSPTRAVERSNNVTQCVRGARPNFLVVSGK